jgi:putative tricarboxylic transport membrane protein
MLKDHVDAVWAMALVIGVGSLLSSLTGLGLAPLLGRLAQVPGRMLVPFVIALGFLGVFAAADDMAQVTVMVGFGVVGYLMTRFGYSLPAAMIGFILGKVVENNLYLVSQLQGWGALKRPITDLMVLITLLSLFGPLLKRGLRVLMPRRTGAPGTAALPTPVDGGTPDDDGPDGEERDDDGRDDDGQDGVPATARAAGTSTTSGDSSTGEER